DDAHAQRLAPEADRVGLVAGIQDAMRELPRPLDIVLLGAVRRHIGDDAHGAAFRVLKGEAIAAAGLVDRAGLLDLAGVGLAHALMDRVHRLFVGRRQIDAQELALVALVNAQNVMLIAGAAQIDRALARRDRLQIPNLGIKPLGGFQIGDAEIDAPDPVYAMCHRFLLASIPPSSSPRKRGPRATSVLLHPWIPASAG